MHITVTLPDDLATRARDEQVDLSALLTTTLADRFAVYDATVTAFHRAHALLTLDRLPTVEELAKVHDLLGAAWIGDDPIRRRRLNAIRERMNPGTATGGNPGNGQGGNSGGGGQGNSGNR